MLPDYHMASFLCLCLFMSLSAAELSAIMREIVLKLFADHLSADGKVVFVCVFVCVRHMGAHILVMFILELECSEDYNLKEL